MADISPQDDDEPETHADRLHGFLRTWGTAEAMLDVCIALIYERHSGRDVDDQTPVTLERKLTFLKTAAETLPSVQGFTDWAMKVHRPLMDEKDLRNTIVHGVPLKRERRGGIHFLRIEPNFENPNYIVRHVRVADWERLDRAATTAMLYLMLLASPLGPGLTQAHLDLSQEAMDEWFVKGAATFPGSKRLRHLIQELFAGGELR